MAEDTAPIITSVDLNALKQWLTRALSADREVSLHSISIPSTGYSAQTILFDLEMIKSGLAQSRKLVLRLEKVGQHVFLDTSLVRQGEMMQALGRCAIPVPAVVGVETDTSLLGGQFLVMERSQGTSLPQSPNYHVAGLLTELQPPQRRLLWEQALSTIARINRLNWREGFEFLNKPEYGTPGLVQYLTWLKAWRDEAMNQQTNEVLDAALEWLFARQPVNAPVDVLWGDSNPGNFLFTRDGQVSAVLDFEAAALGPAEIDLAWWFFMDEMFSAGHARQTGLPDRAEQIALFEQHLGRPVEHLDYYEVIAAIRIALVLARSTNLLIEAGRLPASNKTAHRNPALQLLAEKIHCEAEPVDADFSEFMAAMNER